MRRETARGIPEDAEIVICGGLKGKWRDVYEKTCVPGHEHQMFILHTNNPLIEVPKRIESFPKGIGTLFSEIDQIIETYFPKTMLPK